MAYLMRRTDYWISQVGMRLNKIYTVLELGYLAAIFHVRLKLLHVIDRLTEALCITYFYSIFP